MYKDISKRARRAILQLIEQEREGEQIERDLIRDVLKIFLQLGFRDRSLYETDFEKHLISETQGYYSVKAKEWIAQDTCPAYMEKADVSMGGCQDYRATFRWYLGVWMLTSGMYWCRRWYYLAEVE